MNIGCLISVRYNSSRLPGKVMLELSGHPSIYWLIRQLSFAQYKTVICTSVQPENDVIVDYCKSKNILVYRGSENDVLSRIMGAIDLFGFSHFVRITGDDLFVDPEFLTLSVNKYDGSDFCYTNLPKGTDFQIVSSKFLRQLFKRKNTEDTEYLTWYFNSSKNKQFLNVSPFGLDTYSFEVDTQEDMERARIVVKELGDRDFFRLSEIIKVAEKYGFPKKNVIDGYEIKSEI